MKQPYGVATRSDQWLVVAVSVAVVVGTLVAAVRRLVQLVPNHDVPVELAVDAPRQPVTLDGVGDPVMAEFDRVLVRVPELPWVSWIAAVVGVVATALAIVVVMTCLALLCRHLAAGRYFTASNTRLLSAAALAMAGGWLVDLVTTTLVGNGALSRLTESDEVLTVTASIDGEYLFAAIVLGCLAAAFHAGERMQRDAEGLV